MEIWTKALKCLERAKPASAAGVQGPSAFRENTDISAFYADQYVVGALLHANRKEIVEAEAMISKCEDYNTFFS